MKKTVVLFAAMGLMALAGCQKTEVVRMAGDVVSFRTVVSGQTKAAVTTASTLESFRATAFKVEETGEAATAYMPGTLFSRQGDGTFTSEDVYYWPQSGKLNFYACSPASSTQITSGATCKSYTISPAASYTEQVDFLFANTNNKGKNDAEAAGGITINFRHAESQIAVMVKNTNTGLKFVVDDWKVAYVAKGGVFTYNTPGGEGGTQTDGNTDDVGGRQLNTWDWTVTPAASAESAYEMGTALAQEVAAGTAEASYVGTKEVNNMILVPQTTTAATQYVGSASGDAANGSYLALKIKILSSDGTVIYSDGAGGTAWAMWPVAFKWEPGKRYNYIVDLAGGGYYETNVNGTDEKFDPVLDESAAIKFVGVTVDDFVDKTVAEAKVTVTCDATIGTVDVQNLGTPVEESSAKVYTATAIGQTAVFTAIVNDDKAATYRFEKWADGNTDNPRTVIVTGDMAIAPVFTTDGPVVTAASSDQNYGTVSINGRATTSLKVASGENVIIKALAVSPYVFLKWNDNSTESVRTVTVGSDITYTAIFGGGTGSGLLSLTPVQMSNGGDV